MQFKTSDPDCIVETPPTLFRLGRDLLLGGDVEIGLIIASMSSSRNSNLKLMERLQILLLNRFHFLSESVETHYKLLYRMLVIWEKSMSKYMIMYTLLILIW